MAPLKPPALSKADLLDGLRAMDWFQFEKVVARLYEKQGYRVNRRGGANPDGGIDMVIEKPGLRRAVQCKQWRNSEVGVKPMREFVGALHSDREDFQSGIFVTLRGYSVPAKQLAELKGIEMLDADDLVRKLEAVGARQDPEILELLQTKSTEKPQAKPTPAADDSRFRPQVWVSPSPIIVPPMAPPEKPQLSRADLLDRLRAIDWFQFEKVVARLYEKQGYVVTRRGGANPDGGIDMVIEKPGIQRAVQCKQWKAWNVGAPAVRNFVGALHIEKFQKGIFVTLRGYTVQAKQLADDQGIEMLDADDLARKLESVDARHDPEILALLADERKFCPKCEAQMVLRTVKNGANAGGHFWGCSTYPRCSYRLQSD